MAIFAARENSDAFAVSAWRADSFAVAVFCKPCDPVFGIHIACALRPVAGRFFDFPCAVARAVAVVAGGWVS